MKISDERIITALLQSRTMKEASELINVSESTIYRRLNDLDFRDRLNESRTALIETATTKLQAELSGAIDVIIEIMNDSENPPQIRLNASDSIIRHCLKITEQCNIIERVERLEEIYNDENNR